ncbi:MAG TPA: amidase [Burkholderiales bacterium]|nr:amidase [Burkholderiales bacterium]
MPKLNELGAREAARRLAAREITAEALVRACLERIDEREKTVGAWIHLDPHAALAQAKALDMGPVRGPLHGLPIGVKDIIDTADMPTAYGSKAYAGHRPAWDAAVVALAREAGAVILGKTASTEFAWFYPGKTANPRNPAHTPGGSSSGSAAAVADGMAPLAFGTQTAGSIVRPASFCGIAGYKPSFGLLPRMGAKLLAESLDTIGALARSPGDAALLVGALCGRELVPEALERAPRIALCRTYEWPAALPETDAALGRAAKAASKAGALVQEIDLPAEFAELRQAQSDIQNYETYRSLASDRVHRWNALSDTLRKLIEAAGKVTNGRYDEARALETKCRARLGEVFDDADVVLTASAPGEAPKGLNATGDPVFCRIWSLLGTPAINVPGAKGPNGLPVGVQVVGRVGDDARALGVAEWLHQRLAD